MCSTIPAHNPVEIHPKGSGSPFCNSKMWGPEKSLQDDWLPRKSISLQNARPDATKQVRFKLVHAT